MPGASLEDTRNLAEEHDRRLQAAGITQVILVIRDGQLVDVQSAGAETTYRVILNSLSEAARVVTRELVRRHLDDNAMGKGDAGHGS